MISLSPLSSMTVILSLIAMAFLALISRFYNKTWLEPGTFFLMIWFLFIIIPAIVTPENPIYLLGIWYIFSFSLSLLLGSLVWHHLEPDRRIDNELKAGDQLHSYTNTLFFWFGLFLFISIFGVVALVSFGINRYNLDTNIFSLSALPNLYYVDRDTGIFTLPWQVKGFMYFVYTASLLGGIIFRFLKDKRKLICLTPILIALFYGLILAVRSGLLLSIILWLAGWLGAKVLFKNYLFNFKTVMLAALSFMIFIMLFISVKWLRSGADDPFLIILLLDNARISLFGFISAFSTWVKDYQYAGLTFGANTLSGPLDLFGIIDREIGYYKENIFLAGKGYTNIYTAFRGLIEDFSIPGSLIIGFAIGVLARISFNKCCRSQFMWLIPLTLFYAFVLYSPIISLFNYNSVIMAWLITTVPLILIHKKLQL